ncbi:hypothetical protein KDA00_02715 [Candidatus Saccharibacteria bacterium]|nr:hypothetical protein [Candidatus Saccharibacteria bacterium]
MQPNNPSPAPPPIDPSQMPQHNPYEFITNPSAPPKKKFSLPSGGGKAQKILLFLGVFVILIAFLSIGSSVLNSGENARKEQLKDVVYQQKELIRVSEIGIKKSTTTEARNLAVTTQITLTSEQSELQDALKKLGVKTDSKTIGGPNKKTDEKLTAAEQANNFDEVFLETLRADLTKYAKAVQTAYKNNPSKKTKSALESQFKNAATLAGLDEKSN